ncbi:MAG: hypothetical protein LBU62_12245 [Bacteroidales bacterium]|jgi:hypothetical protein|nr:hypothetical protein [Bacteroidales bacterium]
MKTVYFQNNTPYTKDKKFKLLLNGREYEFFYPFRQISVDESTPIEVQIKHRWKRSVVYRFEPKEDLTLRVTLNKKVQNRALIWGVGLCALVTLAVILFSPDSIKQAGVLNIPIYTMLIYFAIKRKGYFTVEEVNQGKRNK